MYNVPKENNDIFINNKRYRLCKKIKSGGEGTVYDLDTSDLVAKIYHKDKLTITRERKIKELVSKNINVNTISFPRSIITDLNGKFLGFTMKKINKTKELYSKIGQGKYESNWDYKSLIKLCITILSQFEILQKNGVLMGDINPQNILVESIDRVFLIDTDSYQIGGYFSEVYKPEFLSPDLTQKISKDSKYLKYHSRTTKDENYAISVLLFYILFDGNYPIVKTICNDFAYPKNVYNFGDYRNVPIFCEWDWKRLNDKIRKNFYDIFKYNKEVSIFEWKKDLQIFYNELINTSGEDLDIIFSKSKIIFERDKSGELEKYSPKKKINSNNYNFFKNFKFSITRVCLISLVLITITIAICLGINENLTLLEILKRVYLSVVNDINILIKTI